MPEVYVAHTMEVPDFTKCNADRVCYEVYKEYRIRVDKEHMAIHQPEKPNWGI